MTGAQAPQEAQSRRRPAEAGRPARFSGSSSISPSPGIPGEGRGEGSSTDDHETRRHAEATSRAVKVSATPSHARAQPALDLEPRRAKPLRVPRPTALAGHAPQPNPDDEPARPRAARDAGFGQRIS